jgi:2-phosphosulfolactate phosphatase
MKKSIVIDYLPESALRYRSDWAVVAVDVIRATTMAITAVSMGRCCYPVDTLEAALTLADQLKNPLLAGELDGDMPESFEMNNTPAGLAKRTDVSRPLVMLSSSGTRLIVNASGCDMLYLGCFRNAESLANTLADGKHPRIALLGAGSRGEFREEDQIGCAWIAARLLKAGYVAENQMTCEIVERWGNASALDCLISHSVAYLKRTNQSEDVEFILEKINDLDETYLFEGNEVIAAPELRQTVYKIA